MIEKLRILVSVVAALRFAVLPAIATDHVRHDRHRHCQAERRAAHPETLHGLKVEFGDSGQPVAEVRLLGLATVEEAALWESLGGKPQGEIDAELIGRLIKDLERTGLFARIVPSVKAAVSPETGAVLEIELAEHPVIRRIVVTGLTEVSEGTVLDAALDTPWPDTPRGAHARMFGDNVVAGIVWQGVAGAAERTLDRLFDLGYRMASLSGEWTPDGTLALEIDEGRIESIEVEGASPRLESHIKKMLRVEPGRVFQLSDVTYGIDRVEDEYPFLRHSRLSYATRAVPQVIEETTDDGRHTLRSIEAAPEHHARSAVSIDGRRVVVHFETRKTESFSVDASDVLKHTPVTGFSPGLRARWTVYDPGNRAHLVTDGAVAARAGNDGWDYLVAPKLRIPGLATAELGFQFHRLTDTSDRWRMSAGHSYLYSFLLNRPDAEYYLRRGFAAFWTAHLAERVTLGAEYRRDRYTSLSSTKDLTTVFNGDEPTWTNPAIDEGLLASLLFRFEYSSERTPLRQVGSLWRHTETSVLPFDDRDQWRTDFHTLATLEVARPGLGGDEGFDFTRLVSDSTLRLATGHNRGLRFRFRAAGGSNLPRQKAEALGGWSALRGYEFKEFRGDWSVLGSVEYRRGILAGFVDLGSVKQDEDWMDVKTGLGLKLYLGGMQVVAAWRADGREDKDVSVRVFFDRDF